MMFPKPARQKNEAVLARIRGKQCMVPGCSKPGVPAHYKAVGAGGPDCSCNVFPLCWLHHAEEHNIGKKTFRKKYGLPLPGDNLQESGCKECNNV